MASTTTGMLRSIPRRNRPTRSQAIYENYGDWLNARDPPPNSLWIYTLNIPCFRDPEHGKCAETIVEWAIFSKEKYNLKNLYLGYSTNGYNTDEAHAVKHMIKDLMDDGINIKIRKVSIS